MEKQCVRVKDRKQLIEKIIRFACEGLFISLEGELKGYGVKENMEDVIGRIKMLKRNSPNEYAEFFVFDLGINNIERFLEYTLIKNFLYQDVWHIKIAKDHLVFESYDHFEHCMIDIDFYGEEFVNSLVDGDIIILVND